MIRPESFTVSRETFATARKKVLADNDEALRPHVKDALRRVGLPSWEMQIVAAALDIFDTTARAEVDEWSPVIDDMRDNFELEMSKALAQTKASDSLEKQAETITRWVSAAAHNAAIEAATTADPNLNVGLEWVTMGDDSVREQHKEASGQQVPTGQAFDIAGAKLMYPGQPVGDPANWINCRCLAMPTMLDTEFTAATAEFAAEDVSRETPDAGDQVAEEPITSAVIVALPAADDPISAASSERAGAHATLLFFGDTAALDEQAFKDALEQFVTNGQVGIITEQVNGRATLGKDAADVVLFDAANLVFIRSGLLEDNTIIQAFQSVEQFPTWLPHVTLGYPEAPALGEYTGEAITFDRLALWFGESRTEYPLGGHIVPAEEPKPTKDGTPAPSTGEEALAALTSLLAAAGLPAATDEAPAEPAAGDPSEEELLAALEDEAYPEVPWYGVLAPESIFSGDGRAFEDEALTQRPLPLPLKFMWEDDEGHTGSFPIGRIDRIWRDAGLIKAEGVFDTSPQAYETVRLLANQIMRGVSVDLDAAALSADSDGTTFEFSAGRICSATICSIPAFAEAFVSIGTWADAATAKVPDPAVGEGVEAPTPSDESTVMAIEKDLLSSSSASPNILGMTDRFEMFRTDAGGNAAEVIKVGMALRAAAFFAGKRPAEMFPDKSVGKDISTVPSDSAIAVVGVNVGGPDKTRAKFRAEVRNIADGSAAGDHFINISTAMREASGGGGSTSLADLVMTSTKSKSRIVDLPLAGFDTAYTSRKGATFATLINASGERIPITSQTLVVRIAQALGEDGAVASIYSANGRELLASATKWVAGESEAFIVSAAPSAGPGVLSAGIDLANHVTSFDVVPVKTKDGPGWITDPKPTKSITSFWVDGRGAAKIGWGAPGDFNRCRVHLAKYVQNPEWLAGLCANLHYRALGVWPGQASLTPQTVMNQPIAPAALTASAAVLEEVSVEYFKNPMLEGPTPVTLGKDGHIFGHLAEWGTCHIGYEQCTTPPHSATDYSFFLTGQVFTDAGPVAVGQLTVGGGHADPNLGVRAAIAHYDNVSTAVADVTVYEDDWGIAFSGRLRPWATPQQIHELFAAGPSGDWRMVTSRGRSSMEMVAAHAVNVQGFPVARTKFAVSHGQQVSLIAAGALAPVIDPAEVFAALDAEIRAHEFSSLINEIETLEGK